MSKECSQCKNKTLLPKPPKFSLDDKYAGYRREALKEKLIQKGLY